MTSAQLSRWKSRSIAASRPPSTTTLPFTMVYAAPWSYLVALVGIILLVTGLIGTCLIYSALGMSTLQKKA
jgi:hypothetical protein